MVKRRKRGLVCALPWQTNRILVKCDQPPEKPVSAPFCRDLPSVSLPVFRGHNVRLKPKCGKMRQDEAVNGSQMVVKQRGSYYRQKQEHKVTSQKFNSLLYTITADFSTIKIGTLQLAECR